MYHPRLSDGGDDEELLKQQSLFMQSRARHRPAARIIRKPSRKEAHGSSNGSVEKDSEKGSERDIISLDRPLTAVLGPGQRQDEPRVSDAHIGHLTPAQEAPTAAPIYRPTQINAPAGASKHKAVDPYAAHVEDDRPSPKGRIGKGLRADRFDTAGVISGILEREYGVTGSSINRSYQAPEVDVNPTGFPQVFKHSASDGASRFRRKREGEKKKKSVFASMLADARAKQAAAAEAAEAVEADNAFHDGWRGSEDASPGKRNGIDASLAREIHSENMQKLAGMTQEEISQAQASLLSMISPETVSAIRKKKGERGASSKRPEMPVSSDASSYVKPGVDDFSNITVESKLFEQADKSLSILDRAKLDWTKDVKVSPSTPSPSIRSEIRFDLEGNKVDKDTDPEQLLGLHHHGRNPTAAGYAIDELLHLSRSSHTAQRTMALRALAGVFHKRALAISRKSQEVLPARLPPDTISVLHMCFPATKPAGISSISFYATAVDAMHAWLVPPFERRAHAAQRSRFRGFERLPPMFHAQYDNSGQLQSLNCRLDTDPHHSEETNFLGKEAGAAAHNGTNSGESVEESEEERRARLQVNGSQRPVYWLLRREFCSKMSTMISMLEQVADGGVAVNKCIEMVSFCAKHSMMAAARIAKSTQLINTLKKICLQASVSESGPAKKKASAMSVAAMELLAVLCQSGRLTAQQLCQRGILELPKQFILSPVGQLEDDQFQAALHLWRICLIYGIDTDDVMTVLLQSKILAQLTTLDTLSGTLHPGNDLPSMSTQVMLYHFLEALCRPKLNLVDAQSQLTHFIEHQCAIALHRLLGAHSDSKPTQDIQVYFGLREITSKSMFFTAGAVAHFVASAITCGHLNSLNACMASTKASGFVDGPCIGKSILDNLVVTSPYVSLIITSTDASTADASHLDALLGYVRLSKALLSTGMLSSESSLNARKSGCTILSWLLSSSKMGISQLTELEMKSIVGSSAESPVLDVSSYSQRSRVFLFETLIEFTQQNNSLTHLIVALTSLPLVLPGDECIASKLLSYGLFAIENLDCLWGVSQMPNSSNATEVSTATTLRKDLLELRTLLYPFFRAFLGDMHCLQRSEKLARLRSSHQEGLPQTLFLTPRIINQQQSTLPLPSHWLFLPLCEENEDDSNEDNSQNISSLRCMVAALTLLWKLEMSPHTGALGPLSKIVAEVKIFSLLQVALSDSRFIFENMSSSGLASLLELYLGERNRNSIMNSSVDKRNEQHTENTALDFESSVGRDNSIGLASRVTTRFVRDPRCHHSRFYARVMHTFMRKDLLHCSGSGAGIICQINVWQACTESKLSHTLETVCSCGLEPLLSRSSKGVTSVVLTVRLLALYCTALRQTLWKRRSDCQLVYGLALYEISSFIFDWAGSNGDNSSDHEWTRREMFESLSRSGANSDITTALVQCGNISTASGEIEPASDDVIKKRWLWVEGKAVIEQGV